MPKIPDKPPTRWLTPEAVKGWASSLTLHGTLLLVMALWYLAPRVNLARTIDTRLMGSEMGVEEGLPAPGGLNPPIELAPAPEPAAAAPTAALPPLEIAPPEVSVSATA